MATQKNKMSHASWIGYVVLMSIGAFFVVLSAAFFITDGALAVANVTTPGTGQWAETWMYLAPAVAFLGTALIVCALWIRVNGSFKTSVLFIFGLVSIFIGFICLVASSSFIVGNIAYVNTYAWMYPMIGLALSMLGFILCFLGFRKVDIMSWAGLILAILAIGLVISFYILQILDFAGVFAWPVGGWESNTLRAIQFGASGLILASLACYFLAATKNTSITALRISGYIVMIAFAALFIAAIVFQTVVFAVWTTAPSVVTTTTELLMRSSQGAFFIGLLLTAFSTFTVQRKGK